jgi:hypothetical protein
MKQTHVANPNNKKWLSSMGMGLTLINEYTFATSTAMVLEGAYERAVWEKQ